MFTHLAKRQTVELLACLRLIYQVIISLYKQFPIIEKIAVLIACLTNEYIKL